MPALKRLSRLVRGRVVWMLALSATFVASAAVAAFSMHYHHYKEWHGQVIGSQWNDGDWHARVEGNGSTTDYRFCQAEAWYDLYTNGPHVIGSTSVGGWTGTCNYWVSPSRNVPEEIGAAFAYASAFGSTVIGGHRHYCDPLTPNCGH